LGSESGNALYQVIFKHWDAEWFYHFAEGSFDTIEWLEINVDNEIMKQDVITLLKTMQELNYLNSGFSPFWMI